MASIPTLEAPDNSPAIDVVERPADPWSRVWGKIRVAVSAAIAACRRALELRDSATNERITYRGYVREWASWLIFRMRLRYAKRSLCERCPACGHTAEHKIRWDGTARRRNGKVGAIIHKCAICMAEFAQPPIADANEWMLRLATDQGEDELARHVAVPPIEKRPDGSLPIQ